jgi:hypothetical protein
MGLCTFVRIADADFIELLLSLFEYGREMSYISCALSRQLTLRMVEYLFSMHIQNPVGLTRFLICLAEYLDSKF